MRLFLIYARAANGCIGKDGGLPWHLSADLKRFKALTMSKPMIMGRKTFASFPSPLSGRRHIVLTRDKGWSAEGAEVARSVEEALALAGKGEAAVIGGAEVFALFEPLANRIELTQIECEYEGDTFMREPGREWVVTRRERHESEGERPAFSFVTLERAG